ncbi:hypothetical protein D3C71_1551560 [compost metagenome]
MQLHERRLLRPPAEHVWRQWLDQLPQCPPGRAGEVRPVAVLAVACGGVQRRPGKQRQLQPRLAPGPQAHHRHCGTGRAGVQAAGRAAWRVQTGLLLRQLRRKTHRQRRGSVRPWRPLPAGRPGRVERPGFAGPQLACLRPVLGVKQGRLAVHQVVWRRRGAVQAVRRSPEGYRGAGLRPRRAQPA